MFEVRVAADRVRAILNACSEHGHSVLPDAGGYRLSDAGVVLVPADSMRPQGMWIAKGADEQQESFLIALAEASDSLEDDYEP